MLNLFESKRLARAEDKDIVFKNLDIKKNNKSIFFQQLTDIYVFAIALGIKNKNSVTPILFLSSSQQGKCGIPSLGTG